MRFFYSFLFCVLLAIGQLFAQTVSTGIAVQGIARNAAKTALVSKDLTFTFTIKNESGTTVYNETATITTDAFGVFSHIIGTGNATTGPFDEVMFHHEKLTLVISVEIDGVVTEISNAPFQYTAYAKSADNGVPTGSIMPFVGTTAPPGWVLCDGQDISAIPGSAPLIALLGGNTVPDLRGMFLRGTGVSPVNGQSGPALLATQDDGLEAHLHDKGTLDVPANSGQHVHSTELGIETSYQNGDSGSDQRYNVQTAEGLRYPSTGSGQGGHDHSIVGSTANTGTNETRPVNFGINYIIKL